jgi:hypothetical protein
MNAVSVKDTPEDAFQAPSGVLTTDGSAKPRLNEPPSAERTMYRSVSRLGIS